jgi:hypothetical protein
MCENHVTLAIVAKNASPIREEAYPHIWVVNSGEMTIKVSVAHDHASHPYVEHRCAA